MARPPRIEDRDMLYQVTCSDNESIGKRVWSQY